MTISRIDSKVRGLPIFLGFSHCLSRGPTLVGLRMDNSNQFMGAGTVRDTDFASRANQTTCASQNSPLTPGLTPTRVPSWQQLSAAGQAECWHNVSIDFFVLQNQTLKKTSLTKETGRTEMNRFLRSARMLEASIRPPLLPGKQPPSEVRRLQRGLSRARRSVGSAIRPASH